MASTVIAQLEPPVLDNTIKATANPGVFAADNGLVRSEFRQAQNAVVFERNGRRVTWTPLEMKYIDSLGLEDAIYSVQEVPLETRASYARFNRVMPDIDDWFIQENNRLKHQVLVQGFQRDPLPFMAEPIQIAFGGRLQFDTDLMVWADGEQKVLPFETGGAIELRTPDGQAVFTLPSVIAYDSRTPERASTTGWYIIQANAPGDLSFYMAVDNAWMAAPDRVYPVVVDPTVVANEAQQSGGAVPGQNVAIAPNGTMFVAYAGASNGIRLYKSTDGGVTWTPISGKSGYTTASGIAIEADNTYLHLIIRLAGGANTDQVWYSQYVIASATWNIIDKRISAVADIPFTGSLAIRKDQTTGKLHIVWQSDYSTSSSTQTVRISTSSDNGSNWTTGTPISGYGRWAPSALPTSSALYQYCGGRVASTSSPLDALVYRSTDGGASWPQLANVTSYPDTTKQALAGRLFDDAQGKIHVVFLEYQISPTQAYRIKHAFSGDGGATFSVPTIVVELGTLSDWNVTQDKNKNLHVLYRAADGLRHIRFDGTWGASEVLDATVPTKIGVPYGPPPGNKTLIAFSNSGNTTLYATIYDTNRAPNPPSNLQRGDFDPAQAADFTWTFSDPDAGLSQGATQQSYQLLIKRASDGVQVYDSGQVVSNVSKHTLPAGTLTSGQSYQWQVRVWDDLGGVSPYSSLATFYASAPPTVTITRPAANGDTVYQPQVAVEWTFSDTDSGDSQSAYRVRLLNAGGAQLYDSAKKTGSQKMYTVPYAMTTATTYQVEVTVWDSHGIQSTPVVRSFITDFVLPPVPTITVTPEAALGRISVAYTNPAPDPGNPNQPAASSVDIYRRESGGATWTRVATGLATNSTYRDYAVASGQSYDYYVRARADNTASADSAVATGAVTLTGLWLHDVADPAGTALSVTYYRDRSEDWRPEAALLQFAGRARPVAEFGEGEDSRFKVSVMLRSEQGTWAQLSALAKRRGTVCVRDPRGRKLFGALLALPETDEHYGQSVSLELVQTAFVEEV